MSEGEKLSKFFTSSCSYRWVHEQAGWCVLLRPFSHSGSHVLVTAYPLQEAALQTWSSCSSPLFIYRFLTSWFFSSISSSSPIFLLLSSIASINRFAPLPDLLSLQCVLSFLKNNFQFRKQMEVFFWLLQDIGWGVCKVCWRGGKEMKRTLPTTKVCILRVKGCMCIWVDPSVCSSLFLFPPSAPSALTSKPSSNALSNKPMIIISPHY